ncbi:uncharacterized protein [Macrobrachium rosenbergii]|uniref:uncharacterized protein n=1 Tax=Macrobrachium rosenbergii TaxID=79674 RepID=UPI0034D3C753
MASSPLECDIYYITYNEDHCPRILPCSHEFCSRCIDELISTYRKECPVCRKGFMANSAKDLMISRGLLDAAKQLPSEDEGPSTSSKEPKKSFLETTKYFRENVTKRGIAECLGAEAEVKDLIESYSEMRKGVKVVRLSSKATLTSIDLNTKLLMNKVEELQQQILKMKESDAQLEAATDFITAAPLMHEAEELLQAMEETVSKFHESKREEHHIKEEILKMRENLEKFVKDTEGITEEEQQLEEGEHEEERDSVVNITVQDFKSFCGCLKKNAQRGIYAVTTFEGKLRVAPVKIESNNQVSVSRLEEGALPPRCFVIQLESLMQGFSPSSPLRAFLDLAYKSTHLGRIIIRMFENRIKGLNFLHMCSGDMGPSYANSQVFDVICKGMKGESVVMGDYVSRGGGGGGTSTHAVSSSREDWERQREIYVETPYRAGEVRGSIFSYEEASRFWIVTRDGHPRRRQGNCFGMVELGLDVLREAILRYPDVTQIKVDNCGLLFCP